MFAQFIKNMRKVIHKMLPYQNIASAEDVKTPMSPEMINAISLWHKMYTNNAPWLVPGMVKSLNLPAFVCAELSRNITLEMKWNITGKTDGNGDPQDNPRSLYLKKELQKIFRNSTLKKKLVQGLASGGMVVKPYVKGTRIYFDWSMAWSIYPISFDDDGNLYDVILPDNYYDGDDYYTRLERHTIQDDGNIKITQRAFKSAKRDILGKEIPLTDVPQWASLQPEIIVTGSDGQMFGVFLASAPNAIDTESPMGASVFSPATDLIQDADEQYSRFLWEFEGSELAVDVDPTALRPRSDGQGNDLPRLNQRLFRACDTGEDGTYEVFSPAIRDASHINGLNQIFRQIEDKVGMSRGAISNAETEAKTATELRINKQRSYSTVQDNQEALENCLRDVVRVMDWYATYYKLAPQGEYELSFSWDDSIITDTKEQMDERIVLKNAGVLADWELRAWYTGETENQAKKAIEEINAAKRSAQELNLKELIPGVE